MVALYHVKLSLWQHCNPVSLLPSADQFFFGRGPWTFPRPMPVNSIGTAGLMPQAQFLSLTLTVALKFGRSSNGALSPDALAAFAPSWVTETGRLLNAGTSTSSKGHGPAALSAGTRMVRLASCSPQALTTATVSLDTPAPGQRGGGRDFTQDQHAERVCQTAPRRGRHGIARCDRRCCRPPMMPGHQGGCCNHGRQSQGQWHDA